jgi:fructokinase
LLGALKASFPVLMGFDTDVNGAALAECRWGAARSVDSCLYITVGTGIGGGFASHGRTLQGLIHPEMGHVRIQQRPEDTFPGVCPFHKNACVEGLASGPALEQRWGRPAHELPPDHQAWEWEADYLAQALVNMIVVLSPECVVLGGGVMKQAHLFAPIRARVRELLNGYLFAPQILEDAQDYIVPPGLGDNAGLLGALALAMDAE